MHLLRVEEKDKSRVMYEQLDAFGEKVQLSFARFNVDAFHHMFNKLTKKTVVDVRKVKTIGQLRKCVEDLRTGIQCKRRTRHLSQTKEEDMVVKYFTWFFEFLNYLRELRDNFVDRIYSTLFKYFYHVGYDSPEREDTLDSAISAESFPSLRSIDSGYGELAQRAASMTDQERALLSPKSTFAYSDTSVVRNGFATRNALMPPSQQFHDIKKLYDYSEIEQLAKRLCHLKERTDHLLDIETSLNKDLLCQDSERFVFHLKIRDIGPENLARFVPDVLLKLEKAIWLGRRWLEKDDEKTKDLNAKLDKLTTLEVQLNKRLHTLSNDIVKQERDLEINSSILTALLAREDRSSELSYCAFDLNKKAEALKSQIKVLGRERNTLILKMTQAADENDKSTYRQLRTLYRSNKLTRFAAERQLATVNFNIHVSESDMEVELELKPSLIRITDDTQDKCEEIERWLENAKKETNAIKTALEPIHRDRMIIQEHMQQKEQTLAAKSNAKFVGSRPYSGDHLISLDAEFLGNAKVGDPLSIFMTSFPDSGHVASTQTPIKTLETTGGTHIPELVASEW